MIERSEDRTILVVDDEPTVRQVVSRFLRLNNYRVVEAENGQDALQALANCAQPIDAVITDVVMPWMGGGKLVEQMRGAGYTIPTIFVSGLVARPDEFLDGSGTQTLLAKPFTGRELLAAMNEALEPTTAGGGSARQT